jgi:hypothetical protein
MEAIRGKTGKKKQMLTCLGHAAAATDNQSCKKIGIRSLNSDLFDCVQTPSLQAGTLDAIELTPACDTFSPDR